MKKFINNSDNVAAEALEGFAACYRNKYRKLPDGNGLILRQHRHDRVALVIGGGSGHEPMFSGFVGRGLGDAAACGNIFASPDPGTIYKVAKAVHTGKGVLFLYGNYAGDNLNFDMAEEMLNAEGIRTAHLRVWDDCASAPKERIADRRGIAGDVLMIKIVGAACDAGLSLEKVFETAECARRNLRSIGVALSPAHIPGTNAPIFTLPEDEMEYGMGIHGEKGIQRAKLTTADEIVTCLYEQLQQDMPLYRGEKVCVLVNGLGSTTLLELSIVYRKLQQLLERDGILIHDADINSYCTTLEMGGFSLSILKLEEDLEVYYDMPCDSPYYSKGALQAQMVEEGPTVPDNILSQHVDDYDPAEGHQYIEAHIGQFQVEYLSAAAVKSMLLYVAEAVVNAEPLLTKVDSAIGDGDHGIGMKCGLKKAHTQLLRWETGDNAYEPFSVVGSAMLMSMGGASGVIFGNLFLAGAKDAMPKKSIDASDLSHMLKRACIEIQTRGGAQVGDKTMVDALAPAVEAMERTAPRGMRAMLRFGQEAAEKGMENTKNMEAKFGRSKTQRTTIGYQDAGATSVWIILRAMADFVENIEKRIV